MGRNERKEKVQWPSEEEKNAAGGESPVMTTVGGDIQESERGNELTEKSKKGRSGPADDSNDSEKSAALTLYQKRAWGPSRFTTQSGITGWGEAHRIEGERRTRWNNTQKAERKREHAYPQIVKLEGGTIVGFWRR